MYSTFRVLSLGGDVLCAYALLVFVITCCRVLSGLCFSCYAVGLRGRPILVSFDIVDLCVQSYVLLLCRFLVSVEAWISCLYILVTYTTGCQICE
jgi:hypothetical protein